ncbi:MAG: hypothetical protein M3P12_12285 [Gemmatimonadota bacterium]|nr:hypothetical protein [Gemmatimonadota bacterium]
MMSTTNRLTAVIYAVFGLGVLAITYSMNGPEFALRLFALTTSIFLMTHSLFRRSLPFFLIGAGVFVATGGELLVGSVNPRIFFYSGYAIIFAGLFLLVRSKRATSTPPTEA